MKKIILFILFICSISLFSQESKQRFVLDKFELGIDNFNSIKNKIKTTELNIWQYENIIKLSYENYVYKSKYCNLVLLIINDKLYGVRYYTLNDRSYNKYINFLNKNYNICHNQKDNYEYWFNKYVEIHYNLIVLDYNSTEWLDSFIHYDSELLKKYPQYKYF